MHLTEDRLRRDRDATNAEIIALEDKRNEIARRLETLGDRLGYIESLLGDMSNGSPRSVPAREHAVAPSPRAQVYGAMTGWDTMEAILRENSGPMRISDIVTRAISGGFGGRNADYKKVFHYLSSVLARTVKGDPEGTVFRKVSRGVYVHASHAASVKASS